ncbi:hypothetical protein J0X19_06715 [Hymenobacter sp. BT186]|uniref:STAS/SEC14 domain-containing protein n=1 Tax=Hymenobacter telluris TaxID=2816474 RepID=A0A939EUT1_9BACT|nr:hypothetical protein [Hymenobacter telluris]MBO0357631.1 hypothetical protein [Hymenobacter telluris]MBW3373658.1 hypothetical protein [Hymenobacter norwichensis]
MPSLYYQNATGCLYAHPDGYALLRYHAGTRSLLDLHEFLLHTGQLLFRRRWHKMLIDQRLLSPYTESEQALLLNYWQARHFTLGRTISAVLLATGAATHCTFTQVWEEASSSVPYSLFDDEAEAAQWLLSQR